MRVSTILDHIDTGHMALPEFQRGYVWNRDQVRGLMDSLYRRHPVGSLLVWATGSEGATARGDGKLAPGVVKLLLDGQQRITSLYGIMRAKPPKFFDGNAQAFTGLRFHLEHEEFSFYSPVKMKDDPLWIDVTDLMQGGYDGLGAHLSTLGQSPQYASKLGAYSGRLTRVLGVGDIDLHIEEVTGPDKTVDIVVDIFNRVNSGGTKLSKGDLALAKICADLPSARDRMKSGLARWKGSDYHLNLDWLLRCVNTVVTGEAKFHHLHDIEPQQFEDGLKRAEKAIDHLLNLIASRLGLDHDRVLFGRYALPTLVHYVSKRGGTISNAVERDRMLFWFLHSAMWGRYSGSTESFIDKDLELLANAEGGLDRLIDELRLWHGGLRVQPEHFKGWSLGARFYPVLYLLTRTGSALDWDSGIELKRGLLGNMSRLEVHHIFPRAVLYKHTPRYRRADVNAVSNFCFLTKDANLKISASRPEKYFPEVESKHPGALASQWIPMDPKLWKVENYLDFLEARRVLLADATNRLLTDLFHAELPDDAKVPDVRAAGHPPEVPGGVESEQEEAELEALNQWVVEQGLPEGECPYELSHPSTGSPIAILDLAWPNGLQERFSQPVCVLLNEPKETLEAANAQGFRYFTNGADFRRYVEREVRGAGENEAAE